VRFERGRWFVAFTVEQDLTRPAPIRPDTAVGVDLGIKTLAVVATSTGKTFQVPNPRHLSTALRKVRRLSRTVSRRQGPDRRRDGIHKLTTALACTYGTVVVEDLHVAGVVRNRHLARHIADASFAEIRRQLTYKTSWHGGTLIVADRWFASSKTCSACGAVKTKLALSERAWTCTTCGTVLDRDVNAAVNLARLAASGADSNGRGADRKTGPARQVAVKRQPGTARADQTGTVPAARRGTANRVSAHAP
jgi:putative transposase